MLALPFSESVVEEAALDWLGGLGYAVVAGPSIAPGEFAAERTDFGQVILEDRLRQALVRLNANLPPEALEGVYSMHYFYHDLSSFPDKEVAKSAKEFTDLYRSKYNRPPDAYAAIAYIAYTEMFRGFEAAKSFEPKKVSAALMANKGQFTSVKGPARWREDHAAEYKYAAFLVKGKGKTEQKNEWDLFTVMGSVGGEAVLPTLKSLGY